MTGVGDTLPGRDLAAYLLHYPQEVTFGVEDPADAESRQKSRQGPT